MAHQARTAAENGFVEQVYRRLAPVYDVFFGVALQHGRVRAVDRMRLRPGQRVLEVGLGSGATIDLYPRTCRVTGIDLSEPMLRKAVVRRAALGQRAGASPGIAPVDILRMDATLLSFPDDTFDVVYAPYVMNAVPQPVAVAREMRRVCKRGGRILFLNHFRAEGPIGSRFEHAASALLRHIGFTWDVDLAWLLDAAGLRAQSVEKVNVPRFSRLVVCVKD